MTDTSREAIDRHFDMSHNHEAGLIPVATVTLISALSTRIAELEQRLENEIASLDGVDRRAKRLSARISELEAQAREDALQYLATSGQAADAYAEQQRLKLKIERAAAVLRLCLKYNTAMHGGAAAHNKRIKDTLDDLEGVGHGDQA